MGACAFIIENLVLGASIATESGFIAPSNEYGYDAWKDPAPSHQVTLAPSITVSEFNRRVVVQVDTGTEKFIDTVALVNTNLPVGTIITMWAYLNPIAEGPTVWQTSVTLEDLSRSRGQVVLHRSSTVEARYIRLIIDTVEPYVQIGQMVVGVAWKPTYTFDIPYQLGRMDYGNREVNSTTGAAFDFDGARPRVYTLTLGTLTQTEAETYVDDLDRLAGATGDILFIPDTALSTNQMSKQAVYGACRLAGEGLTANFFPNIYRRPLRIQERM